MIYLELFLGFLKVGCFAFGGAYAAIPLIREVVLDYGWINDEMLSTMIAVSESTPGPIMVNMATYVGSDQAGVLGAALATFAVVLPAFLIILLILWIFKHLIDNKYVQAVLNGIKPCVIGVIFAVGAVMVINNILPVSADTASAARSFDWRMAFLTVVLGTVYFGSRKLKLKAKFLKKGISPILLIGISAAAGLLLYGLS